MLDYRARATFAYGDATFAAFEAKVAAVVQSA
jgi:hypothetical protein